MWPDVHFVIHVWKRPTYLQENIKWIYYALYVTTVMGALYDGVTPSQHLVRFLFSMIVPLWLHIIMKNHVLHVLYNLQNLYNLHENAGNCISRTLDYNFFPWEHAPLEHTRVVFCVLRHH